MQCTQALNIIIHVCPGGRGTRKCCPKSSYCLRAMNWGGKKSQKISHPYTWASSQLSFPLRMFIWTKLTPWLQKAVFFHDMFSGIFVSDAASNVLINQTLLPGKEDDLNIWSANLTYNYAEYLAAFDIPKLTLHSRKTCSFQKVMRHENSCDSQSILPSGIQVLPVIMATKRKDFSSPGN